MYSEQNDALLLFDCVHCNFEYVLVGVDIDDVKFSTCPKCEGQNQINAMSIYELVSWLMRNLAQVVM